MGGGAMMGFDPINMVVMLDMMDEQDEEIKACPGHDFTRPVPEHGEGRFVCAHCPKLLVTQTIIDENLNNAVEGGHDCRFDTIEDVCNELLAYSCDCETSTVEELTPFVSVWLRQWL